MGKRTRCFFAAAYGSQAPKAESDVAARTNITMSQWEMAIHTPAPDAVHFFAAKGCCRDRGKWGRGNPVWGTGIGGLVPVRLGIVRLHQDEDKHKAPSSAPQPPLSLRTPSPSLLQKKETHAPTPLLATASILV